MAMILLYILGNGFDLTQGMATGYEDFYKYLENEVANKSTLLKNFLDYLMDKENHPNWADMEFCYGEFMSELSNSGEFKAFHNDIIKHLKKYIVDQEKMFVPTPKQKETFCRRIDNPYDFLKYPDNDSFQKIKRSFGNPMSSLTRVMTFNYTSTFEKLIEGTALEKRITGRNLIHIHGRLPDDIIMGVDNEDQINNELFKVDDDVKDYLVKSQSNIAMERDSEKRCKEFISSADIIMLYGVSLGETDDKWWKAIKEELRKRPKLAIIFNEYNQELHYEPEQEKGKARRAAKKKFAARLGIKSEEGINLDNRLFVMLNSKIFKV